MFDFVCSLITNFIGTNIWKELNTDWCRSIQWIRDIFTAQWFLLSKPGAGTGPKHDPSQPSNNQFGNKLFLYKPTWLIIIHLLIKIIGRLNDCVVIWHLWLHFREQNNFFWNQRTRNTFEEITTGLWCPANEKRLGASISGCSSLRMCCSSSSCGRKTESKMAKNYTQL